MLGVKYTGNKIGIKRGKTEIEACIVTADIPGQFKVTPTTDDKTLEVSRSDAT